MTRSYSSVVLFLLSLVAFVGCRAEAQPTNFKETIPVKGRILVDGAPAESVTVQCVSTGGIDQANPSNSSAATDKDGNFSMSTYKAADGVPAGDYALTFQWYGKTLTKSESAPDKLKGRYKNAKDSPAKFTAKKGEPVDLGEIKLTTK